MCGLKEGGQWAKAKDYTPRLSGVIKLARLMVIRQAYEARQQSIARRVERGTSQMHAEEESPSHVQLVQGMTQRFMMLMPARPRGDARPATQWQWRGEAVDQY